MGTYLEDSLESMYMLPSEVKRNFDLMRELDKTSYPLLEELRGFHRDYLVSARKKVLERCANRELPEPEEHELRALVETDAALTRLREKHQRVVQKLDEKIAIAAQSYDIVDHHIRRLDQDLEAYAALLKANGEFEDDRVGVKKRKLAQANAAGSGGGGGIGGTGGGSNGDLPRMEIKQGAQLQLGGAGAGSGAAAAGGGAGSLAAAGGSSSSSSRKGSGSGSASGRKRSAVEVTEVPIVVSTIPLATDDLPIDPNEPIYCHCRRVSYGQMVGCDNDDCKYEWFHFECVGLTDQPQGKWYCKDCKALLGIK